MSTLRSGAAVTKTVCGLLLSSLALAGTAHAASVYRCRDAAGLVAYQDHACDIAQQSSQVQIAAVPPVAASPDYGIASHHREPRPPLQRRARRSAAQAVSYECRADNGEVFYRHSACPKSIRTRSAPAARRGSASVDSAAVVAVALPRAEVCRRLAGSRNGHERDDRVSTYERNLGRDPCRRS